MQMGFFRSLDISASGLTAQRMRMDVIAENIANISTTKTATGGAYRRRYTEFQAIDPSSFSDVLSDSIDSVSGGGVRVSAIKEDQSALKTVYDPTNADADANGYVQMPNVDLSQEMVDMISATRAYEANVTALNAMKELATKALEIGK
jgi:flagellar basal-body rod protein FlgC